jgi:hypothetical protein
LSADGHLGVELTAREAAALSNTICADVQSARSLEARGLVEIRDVARVGDEDLAFFDLTDAGEAYVNRHFVIQLPADTGRPARSRSRTES